MYISDIAWCPNHPISPRILILGESHYDKKVKQGEINKHVTSSVVKYLLEGNVMDKWKEFFYNIAASFGYSKNIKDIREFYGKVYFANYVEESCDTGDVNDAHQFIKDNRDEYNQAVFEFCNEKNISIICAFSKKAYRALPKIDKSHGEQVSNISITHYYTVGKTYYKKGVNYDRRIKLNNDLLLYGFNHASRSGYKNAYEFLSKEFNKHDILKHQSS